MSKAEESRRALKQRLAEGGTLAVPGAYDPLSARLIERARSGQLSEVDLTGGTFSLSNLGMYGVSMFSAIIHPGQGAILAVGGVHETVAVRNGHPDVGQVMTLTLSADHRLIDGVDAARFLCEVRRNLETPVRLLI